MRTWMWYTHVGSASASMMFFEAASAVRVLMSAAARVPAPVSKSPARAARHARPGRFSLCHHDDDCGRAGRARFFLDVGFWARVRAGTLTHAGSESAGSLGRGGFFPTSRLARDRICVHNCEPVRVTSATRLGGLFASHIKKFATRMGSEKRHHPSSPRIRMVRKYGIFNLISLISIFKIIYYYKKILLWSD